MDCRCFCLKGSDSRAQGNTLGTAGKKTPSPEKGDIHIRDFALSGLGLPIGTSPQGVTLGSRISAFQAEKRTSKTLEADIGNFTNEFINTFASQAFCPSAKLAGSRFFKENS